jgi:hypothetical protein
VIVAKLGDAAEKWFAEKSSSAVANARKFIAENPTFVVGGATSVCAALSTGVAAMCGDAEDIALTAVVSAALAGSITTSCAILSSNGVDMTNYVNITTVVAGITGTLAFGLAVKEIVSAVKHYMISGPHTIPEAKEEPSVMGMIADVSMKVGVLAGLAGLIVGDSKNLHLIVTAWRDIKSAFLTLSDVYAKDVKDLVPDVEAKLIVAEKMDEKIPVSLGLLGRISDSKKFQMNLEKSRSEKVALGQMDPAAFSSENDRVVAESLVDQQIKYLESQIVYVPKCDVKDAEFIGVFRRCALVDFDRHADSYKEMQSHITRGNVFLEESATLTVKSDSDSEDIELIKLPKVTIWFKPMDKVKDEPSKIQALVSIGDKIQNYVCDHSEQFIVGGAILGSIIVAAAAGFVHRNADAIHTKMLSVACDVASPVIEKSLAKSPTHVPPPKLLKESEPEQGLTPGEGNSGLENDDISKSDVYRRLACKDIELTVFLIELEHAQDKPAFLEGRRNEKNMNSADRGQRNKREHQRDIAQKEWKEFKDTVRNFKTDNQRYDYIDQLIEQRDAAENNFYDFGKHGNVNHENYQQGKQALWEQLNSLKKNLFEMYDLYNLKPRTENTAKVTTQAVPENKPAPHVAQPLIEKPKNPLAIENLIANASGVTIVPQVSAPKKPEAQKVQVPVQKPQADDKGKKPESEQIQSDKVLAEKLQVELNKKAPPAAEANAGSAGEKRKRSRGNRGKGKKKEKKESEKKPEPLPEPAKKKSFADAAKSAPKPKAEADKAVKPTLKSVNPERPKPVCWNCGGSHVINSCKTLPEGYKIFKKEEWEKLEPQEKRKILSKNRKLVPKKTTLQSVSLHEPTKGKLPEHDNLIPIFLPGCNNPGVNSEFWGTMLKVKHDDVTYICITEHQLKENVYYLGTGEKAYSLPAKERWDVFGEGELAYYRIPAGKLQGIRKGSNLSVGTPYRGTQNVAMFVGIDPNTMEEICAATSYSYQGGETKLVHNTSTKNFSCGNFLIDSKLKQVVGLHYGTIGPAKKHGDNNLMIPLKAVGLRRSASP